MSLETQVSASALDITIRINCFSIQRLVSGVFEYVSKGVTLDEPLTFDLDLVRITANNVITVKWSSAVKIMSGLVSNILHQWKKQSSYIRFTHVDDVNITQLRKRQLRVYSAQN